MELVGSDFDFWQLDSQEFRPFLLVPKCCHFGHLQYVAS